MLPLHAIDQTEDFLKDGESYMLQSKDPSRYNYAIALLKKQQLLERSDSKLKFIPHHLLLLNYFRYYARFLLIALLLITSVIPFLNILSCLALLFLCIIYIWTMKTIRDNQEFELGSFNNMIQYNDLCFDSQGRLLPSQYFMIDLQSFVRESRDIINLIKEMVGVWPGDEQVFLIAYRLCVRNWFENQQVLDWCLLICLFLAFFVAVFVTAAINMVIVGDS